MKTLEHTPNMTVGIAARLLGISPSLIRLYESEGLLCLHREPSGHRLLSSDDLNRVTCIRQRLDGGLNFEGLRQILALIPCWEIKGCNTKMRDACPAFNENTRPCWAILPNNCKADHNECRLCKVYQEASSCTERFKQYLQNTRYIKPQE